MDLFDVGFSKASVIVRHAPLTDGAPPPMYLMGVVAGIAAAVETFYPGADLRQFLATAAELVQPEQRPPTQVQ